jgi:hypothetical protein
MGKKKKKRQWKMEARQTRSKNLITITGGKNEINLRKTNSHLTIKADRSYWKKQASTHQQNGKRDTAGTLTCWDGNG